MMGHLVFGRYGHDSSALPPGAGWLRRLWTSLFARGPVAAR